MLYYSVRTRIGGAGLLCKMLRAVITSSKISYVSYRVRQSVNYLNCFIPVVCPLCAYLQILLTVLTLH